VVVKSSALILDNCFVASGEIGAAVEMIGAAAREGPARP
jgi:hypothetical protein